jgi:DNA-binding XRE family transcriptional regulator
MATLASFPTMMQRHRTREGLRECRAAWVIGLTVREYREIEAGDRTPSLDTYQRISELYGWPQTFTGRATRSGGVAIHPAAGRTAGWAWIGCHITRGTTTPDPT